MCKIGKYTTYHYRLIVLACRCSIGVVPSPDWRDAEATGRENLPTKYDTVMESISHRSIGRKQQALWQSGESAVEVFGTNCPD
jgi:hypothetical protein